MKKVLFVFIIFVLNLIGSYSVEGSCENGGSTWFCMDVWYVCEVYDECTNSCSAYVAQYCTSSAIIPGWCVQTTNCIGSPNGDSYTGGSQIGSPIKE